MTGNMYKGVITWNPLAGCCLHECEYCSTINLRRQWIGCNVKYTGDYRLARPELSKYLGVDNTIFVCAQNDLLEKNVWSYNIDIILDKCQKSPGNLYLFQTKNPARYSEFIDKLPENYMLGTTIETNRTDIILSKAPSVTDRAFAMCELHMRPRFVTIEPIVDFDLEPFVEMLRDIAPDKIFIGADSKRHNLPEPSAEKVQDLIKNLRTFTIVEEKSNLKRITG